MTPKQERALAALVLCPTAREAAKAAGLAESTLHRYKQDPEFMAEYRKRCNESLETACTKAKSALPPAIERLNGIVQDDKQQPREQIAAARAVLEYAANPKRLGAKTLFATHYHELSTLEDKLPNVKNYNIAVKKRGEQMIFLRKIVPGATDDSYGIEVAKLAGIPAPVITRAREILAELESEGVVTAPAAQKEPEDQVSMMDLTSQQVVAALSAISVETLTPIEAMNELYKLKKMLD